MPYIYARTKVRACKQCSYYSEGEDDKTNPCNWGEPIAIHRQRSLNTYECGGFVDKDNPKEDIVLPSYLTRGQR